MATLAIKGHATRGREVIGLLEMLGGKNSQNFNGFIEKFYYCICCENHIGYQHASALNTDVYCAFTLEQFLEKFPYKIGDKVQNKVLDFIGTIINMRWVNNENTIVYEAEWNDDTKSKLSYYSNGLQPYTEQKEETAEEKGNNWAKWDLPEGYEFQDGNGNVINATKIMLVKKQTQYPKTYEECCEVLGINELPYMAYTWNRNEDVEVVLQEYQTSLIIKLDAYRKLLTCRDAYWKMAGDWKPDWGKTNYYIRCIPCFLEDILPFPTEEMRDAFYENFKELIEQCKELL